MAYDCYIESLVSTLARHVPFHVESVLNRHRQVNLGLLSVGLKIHCIEEVDSFDEIMYELLYETRDNEEKIFINGFRKREAVRCWVLPPVGNTEVAIRLLEVLGKASKVNLFGDPNFEIQVCSPGRLDSNLVPYLSISTYLGSDMLRWYGPHSLDTTFSRVHKKLTEELSTSKPAWGRRLALYDANGFLDEAFHWWRAADDGSLEIANRLPFQIGRTDVLNASTRLDIRNANLVSTLLVHRQWDGYWGELGDRFCVELQAILERHQLSGILEAPWITTGHPSGANDQRFFEALDELMTYAFQEHQRIVQSGCVGASILEEVRELLERHYTIIKVHASHALKGE